MAVAKERDPDATRDAITRWLQERTGADDVAVGEIRVPGLSGFSNETLIIDAAWGGKPRGLVLRVEPSGHQVFPSTAFDAQVKVLRALAAEGSVPVPEVLWFEEDPATLGDRFVAMARVDGQVPADTPSYHQEGWLTDLPPEQQGALWNDAIDTMARIHQLDRKGIGLEWIEPVAPADQLELDREYRRFVLGDSPFPILDEAEAVLAASIPSAVDEPALCWGDSRIGNMIFGDDGRVAAVLDWEMVSAGDPVQDLAWNFLLDRHHWEGFEVERLPGLPSRDETVARWEAASGYSAEHLDWYELLGSYRYAAVLTRVLLLLDSTGLIPGTAAMAYDHTGSQLLRRLLDERA
ncbi:MAG: phosphotransferase family protein [Actinomycetota bacterium]|nr:phosphotransferase family protein [Actinomycetota bacterium]